MHRSTAAAAALILALHALPLPEPAQAQGQVSFTVNVVSARSLGCSPDRITDPDLRVRVLLNGVEALVTPEANDNEAPVYGMRAEFQMAMPVRVSVEVQEGEPGGFLFLGTTWVPCDTQAGPGTWHNFTYEGSASERILARGDGDAAAEAVVVVGRSAPPSPAARVANVTADGAEITWDAPPRDAAEVSGHRIALGGTGEEVGGVPAGATSARLSGLCDGQEHVVRVLRDAPPWTLSSPDVTFATPNAPPGAARVLRADATARNATVSWESPTTHDVVRYEVHAGADAGFAAGPDALRGSLEASAFDARPSLGVALRAGDAFVRVLTLDEGGLSAVSDAFALNAPARSPSQTPSCGSARVDPVGGPRVVSAPAATPPGPRDATPTPDRTTRDPSDEGTTTLLPDQRGVDAAGAEGGGPLGGGSDLLLVGAVGLLGVALGALLVVLLRRR